MIRRIRPGSLGLPRLGIADSRAGFGNVILARLAESDLLRHIQVLSCVSGGSMIGAAYYLRLRELLQRNAAPARSNYVALVEALIEEFREGTNANLRSSLFVDLKACHAIISGNDRLYAERVSVAIFKSLYSRTLLAASYFAPGVLGRWSWSVQLIDPIGAVRSRVSKRVAALVTWTLARWFVPRLTSRYLEAGRIEQLSADQIIGSSAGDEF